MALVRLLGALLIAGAMLIAHPILKWRDRWRYTRAASRLGFDPGRVISKVVGPPLADPGLTIVSLRPGDWQDVVDSIRADARAAGYEEPLPPPGGIPPHDQSFNPPPGITWLPRFRLSAYPPGAAIGPRNVTVPPGHTGLRIRLS